MVLMMSLFTAHITAAETAVSNKITKSSAKAKLQEFGINWSPDEDWTIVSESNTGAIKSIVMTKADRRVEFSKVLKVTPAQFKLRTDNEIKLFNLSYKSSVTPYAGEISAKAECKILNLPPLTDRHLNPSDKNSRVVEIFYGETSRYGATMCESQAKYAVIKRLSYNSKESSFDKITIYRTISSKASDVFDTLKSDLTSIVSITR